MSLQDILNRIKPRPETEIIEFDEKGEALKFPLFRKLFLSITIILVASLSFGIGRLSVVGKREPIRIENDSSISNDEFLISNQVSNPNAQTANVITATQVQSNTTVVGSKNGSKYHYSHCSGAKQIKEENKIVFSSPQTAEAAGYSLAANCKPK